VDANEKEVVMAVRNPKTVFDGARFVSLGSGIKAAIMEVTPKHAAEWLEMRRENRSLRATVVDRYSRDVAAGKWVLTHQAIAFDNRGLLYDGQHRLQGVVNTNEPIMAVVFWGFPKEAFEATDIGAKRTVADVLMVNKDIVAVAQQACGFNERGMKIQLSPQEIRRVLAVYGDDIELAVASLMSKRVAHVTISTVAGVMVLALVAGEPQERVVEFAQVLRSGIPGAIPDDLAALRLRELLLSSDIQVRGAGGIFRRKMARALEAFCQREKITKLYAPKVQPYPYLSVPSLEEVENYPVLAV
jgi:hypothetical protein